MYAIEILDASNCYLAGSITFQVNQSRREYTASFGSSQGFTFGESGQKQTNQTREEFDTWLMQVLPKDKGWTPAVFTVAWVAFAEGMSRGRGR